MKKFLSVLMTMLLFLMLRAPIGEWNALTQTEKEEAVDLMQYIAQEEVCKNKEEALVIFMQVEDELMIFGECIPPQKKA